MCDGSWKQTPSPRVSMGSIKLEPIETLGLGVCFHEPSHISSWTVAPILSPSVFVLLPVYHRRLKLRAYVHLCAAWRSVGEVPRGVRPGRNRSRRGWLKLELTPPGGWAVALGALFPDENHLSVNERHALRYCTPSTHPRHHGCNIIRILYLLSRGGWV